MIQLAWRWLMFQKNSTLAKWYRARTTGAKQGLPKAMIVALARKLLIALWRYVTIGEVPAGAVLRQVRRCIRLPKLFSSKSVHVTG